MAKKEKTERKKFLDQIEVRKYELDFQTPILGMSPLDKDIFCRYIMERALKNGVPQEDLDDELDMIEDSKETKMTGFYKDVDGVYLLSHQIRGFFKNSGNVLKKVVDVQALKSKIENFMFIFPRHIWLKEKIDGYVERPLQVDTPKGKRTALACSEMVKDIKIKIEIHLIPHDELTFDILEEVMDYGRYEGISQWRGAGYGSFLWKRAESI